MSGAFLLHLTFLFEQNYKYRLQIPFLQYSTAFSIKHSQTCLKVVRFYHHMSLVILSKGIHIFYKDFFFCQILQNHGKRAGSIVTTQADNFCRHYGKVLRTQYFHSLIHIRYDKTEDSEICCLCHTEGMHVYAVLSQRTDYIVYSSCLVFQEY